MKARQLVLLAAALLGCDVTSAAGITVVSTVGLQGVLERVRQEFEHSSTYRLDIRFGTSAVLKRQLDSGEAFDVAILTPAMIDDLAKQGKVVGAATASVAKAGIGVAVKAGTTKPVIGTRDALRSALLASSGIAYTKEGQSGAAVARMFVALGVAEELQARTLLDPRPGGGLLAVAEGKAALAFALMSEIIANSRVDLVGPLPGDLQTYVLFAAGMAADSKEPQGGRAFIAFLGSPAVRREIRKLGMESE